MPDVKYKCTRLTPITFQNEVDVILQSVLLLITYHFLTNQEGGTIMINHFRPHPIGVNKPKPGNPNESSENAAGYRGGITASARVLYKRL